MQPQREHSSNITQIMQSYLSTKKMNDMHSPVMGNSNEFTSMLFSIGVISLELKRLEFADGVYLGKKEVNHEEIAKRVSEFRDVGLRNGI